MALAAWPLPQAQGSDLTEIPARDEEDPHATITVDTREIDEYSGYVLKPACSMRWTMLAMISPARAWE